MRPAGEPPQIIAHRGASGDRPEHTLASYALAIAQGADFIEPDLVLTRDGVLIARHENEIGGTTDVAEHPEFAARRTVKRIDGQEVTGWFTEDFTYGEILCLRARERIPQIRPANRAFDGRYGIPSFEEILSLLAAVNARRAVPVGVYPETKHPSYFSALGLEHDEPLLDALRRFGYLEPDSRTRIFLQSFETGNLRRLRRRCALPLVQLLEHEGAPYDLVAAGIARSYRELATPAGLREIATYADAIGPNKLDVIPRLPNGHLGAPASLAADAHAAGLEVHPWTFRAENAFLPSDLRSSARDDERGDLAAELRAYAEAGVDAVFTDQPEAARRAWHRAAP